jgi:signal transduction histidine kinase
LAAQRQALDAERVRALEHLNRSLLQERATLAALMESVRDGLVVADAAGAIRYCNSRAAALLGTTADAATGQSAEAFVGAALRDAIRRAPAAASSAPTGYTAPSPWPPLDSVHEVTLAGPPRRDLRLEWFPVREGDSQLGYGLLLREVTEERALERAKDEFTSMLSHELRSPIGIIKGFATTLLNAGGELTDSERADSLRFVDQASDQLLDLVNNLLDLSRISAGTFAVAPQPARLDALIESTARQMITARGTHQLRLDLAPDLPLVMADSIRVEQVLRNLLDNAMKYSPGDTTIHVTATVSLAAHDRDRPEVVVSVDDEGAGIAPDELERLFERYQRGHDARTRNVAGAGLGLAISRHLVHAHRGRIWAESPVPYTGTEGHDASEAQAAHATPGTRFSFTLPAVVAAVASGAPDPRPTVVTTGAHP